MTRLAPSPTGALHLGNARTFLINWALAVKGDWRIVLRIEDLDTPRTKPGADQQAVDDLQWLGMHWDEGPYRQAHDLSAYHAALRQLSDAKCIYPCPCSRREIEAAQSAPHSDDHELRYPGTCRPPAATDWLPWTAPPDEVSSSASHSLDIAWRLLVPDDPVTFTDEVAGPQCLDVQAQVGDFVVATKAGLPSYQLAVVVDDIRHGITDVVRGDDLVPSAARQAWLYRMLGHQPPRWWHLPLVLGEDGRRLAKRHGDTRLAWYREQGVLPQRVIGLIASWCGILDRPASLDAETFAARFDLHRLPRGPITFTADDHAWLTS